MISWIENNIGKPPVQAGLILIAGLILMIFGWALTASKLISQDPLMAWSIAAAFLLLFAILNSLMSLRADSFVKYWGTSMYSYTVLALCSGSAAWLISGIPIGEAGSYRWIIFVVTFGFLVFLSLVNFLKKIVEFAEKEEWNQPRIRRRK
jgi:ABC-type Na+ efflux pump permease subunit